MQRIYWKHPSETSFLRLTVADLQPVSLQTYELFKILFLNLFYVYDFLLAYMYVHHTYLQKSEEASDSLELALQMVINHHAGSRNKSKFS